MQNRRTKVKAVLLPLASISVLVAIFFAVTLRHGDGNRSARRVSVRAATPTGSSSTAAPDVLPAGSSLAVDSGSITVKPAPASQPPTLTPPDVYAAYLKYKGGSSPYDVEPSYEYGLFSDANYSNPDKSGNYVPVYQNVPAWALVFHGVPVVSSRGEQGISNEIVFVSDKTGAILEELTNPVADTKEQVPAQ